MDAVVEATDRRTGPWMRRMCLSVGPWNEERTKTKSVKGTEVRTIEPREKMGIGEDAATRVGNK